MNVETTVVAIVGGGPAGLLLSLLLHESGVPHVVLESRARDVIAAEQRAGIIEDSTAKVLVDHGLDRILTEGDRHDGIYLRFEGEMHHVNFLELTGHSVHLYPQTKIFEDLSQRALTDGRDVRWEHTVVDVQGRDTDSPTVTYTDPSGDSHELRARLVVGADGSRSVVRHTFPDEVRRTWSHEYPYAWFGIIVEAPRSAPELVYNESERGFCLISQRTEVLQRMYFQCDPDEQADAWSEAQIWDEFAARIAGTDGFALKEGPIVERAVLRFRSSVVDPIHMGRVVLVGDAAHTVPPTGAKGLNLALADVVLLHRLIGEWLASGDDRVLDEYGKQSSRRVWRAQHFSAWMSRMLHTTPDEPVFERRRRLAELRTLSESTAGKTFLAEGYTGWGDI